MRHAIRDPSEIFYGWWLLAASAFALSLVAGVTYWSPGLYVAPLEEEFGWSRAEVTAGFSVAFLLMGLTGPIVGRWVDVSGPRWVLATGGLLVGSTFALIAVTDSLWQWYLFLSINTICRQLILFIPLQALISRWFVRRRGFAFGVLASASAVGGLVIVPVLRLLIDRVSWEASFVVTGIAVAVVFVPLGLFVVRDQPSDMGTFPDGSPPPEDAPEPAGIGGVTLGEAMRTPVFWALAFALGIFFYSFFGFMVHQIPFYESVGVSRGVAALLVAIMAGVTIVSRLFVGVAADRIERVEWLAMALCTVLMAGMAVLLINSGAAGIAVFVLLFIMGSGAGPVLQPLLLTRAFGVSNYGAIMGVSIVVQTSLMTFSPVIAGAMFDATGTYQWVLVMFLCTFGLALALFYAASRMAHPIEEPAAPQASLQPAAAGGGR